MNWLQRALGIDVILAHLTDLRNLRLEDNRKLDTRILFMQGQIIASNRGIGRLIAKLDPSYGQDELDPTRRKASDDLSDQIIKKLIAEHVMSNRMNPDGH